MKVLHICTFDKGGATMSAKRLHKGLLNLGIESSMLFLNKSGQDVTSSTYYTSKKPFIIRALRKFNLFKTTQEETQPVIRESKSQEVYSFAWTDFDITNDPNYKIADIIHLHWVDGFVDYKSFFKNNTKQVVWTLHDQNAFTGLCHYSAECKNYISNCTDCPILSSNLVQKSFLEKYNSLKNVKNLVIVSPSKWLYNLSKSSKIFQNYNQKLIPYGLDHTVFKPYKKENVRELLSLPKDKKIILFICDYLSNKRKGFHLLVNAIKQINSNEIHFIAIGQSDVKVENVRLFGRINDEALLAMIYSAADALILPSLEDNLPNTMIESLSCGTPVIGFNVGGIADTITHSFNGILCNETTIESLKAAIMQIVNNDIDFIETNIRNFAVNNYNEINQAKSYLDVYKNLLKQ